MQNAMPGTQVHRSHMTDSKMMSLEDIVCPILGFTEVTWLVVKWCPQKTLFVPYSGSQKSHDWYQNDVPRRPCLSHTRVHRSNMTGSKMMSLEDLVCPPTVPSLLYLNSTQPQFACGDWEWLSTLLKMLVGWFITYIPLFRDGRLLKSVTCTISRCSEDWQTLWLLPGQWWLWLLLVNKAIKLLSTRQGTQHPCPSDMLKQNIKI